MKPKNDFDTYANELNRRFEDLTRWAIANWPRDDFRLMESDFDASRREIGEIIGPKLGQSDEAVRPVDLVPDPPGLKKDDGNGQFRDLNPMPWP